MPESSDPERLYEAGADLYDALFGEGDPEEVSLYSTLLADAPNNHILSLGCGTGRLEAALSATGFAVTGVDASERMLARARQRDPRGHYLLARMEDLPPELPGQPFGAVISATLSFAYITSRENAEHVIRDCARFLAPNGLLALDVPIAHEPARLQGVIETMETPSGHHYRFMWYDVIAADDACAVLDTDIWITGHGRAAARRAPLAVYRPEGLRDLLQGEGLFASILFHAPHDIATATRTPPPHCRRAVVTGKRMKDEG